jgi:hypothetical protein
MDLTTCPSCHMQVLPNPDGTCPNCHALIPQKEQGSPSISLEPPKIPAAITPAEIFVDNSAILKKDLRGLGILLIIWGAIPFVFPQAFSRGWGVIIIVLGIVNLLVSHRVLFILSGAAFLAVGAWNSISFLLFHYLRPHASWFSNILWIVLGILQIIWGVQMIKKYNDYPSGRKL